MEIYSQLSKMMIMKFIHKFQQNDLYIENKTEIENYERQNCRF